MKDLAQYPVTFPYGSTAPPYSTTHSHRGNDRAAPVNTPIIVCGVTIGYVGMTGDATGYHCHTQEWLKNHVDVRKPQNEFKPGTVTEVDVNGTTGDKTLGKYVTIKDSDGWSTTYCHMNTTNANVGEIIKEENVEPTDYRMNQGDVINGFAIFNRVPSQADLDAWVGQTFKKFQYEKITDGVAKMPPTGVKPYSGDELFVKE